MSAQNEITMNSYFLLDDDKEIFFDYLSFLKNIACLQSDIQLSSVVRGLTSAISLNYLYCKNTVETKVADKYEWLLKYLLVWKIKNPGISDLYDMQNFKTLLYNNSENIMDYQNCCPLFKQTVIAMHGNFILLTNNNCFPTNAPREQTLSSLIKSIFSDENKIEGNRETDAFNNIGVEIYRDKYLKRPVLEITQYFLFKLKYLESFNNSKYYWAQIQDISAKQKQVLYLLTSLEK